MTPTKIPAWVPLSSSVECRVRECLFSEVRASSSIESYVHLLVAVHVSREPDLSKLFKLISCALWFSAFKAANRKLAYLYMTYLTQDGGSGLLSGLTAGFSASFQVMVVVKYIFQFGFFPWNSSFEMTLDKPFFPPRILGLEKTDNYIRYDLLQLLALFFHRSLLMVSPPLISARWAWRVDFSGPFS